MKELKMGGMKSYAGDPPLGGFRRVVLSVTDDRVADGGKLYSDLVLQSRHQRNPEERSGAKAAFDRIPEFGTGRFVPARCGQPLKHSLPSKVVD
jgi:hypothetical protein